MGGLPDAKLVVRRLEWLLWSGESLSCPRAAGHVCLSSTCQCLPWGHPGKPEAVLGQDTLLLSGPKAPKRRAWGKAQLTRG